MTEGYNILPNFFISAKLNEMFSYDDDNIEKTDRKRNRHKRVQFDNRLFDRDTLLLSHYDVNFLYVLSLYARDNQSQKTAWKMKVRQRFCKEIQKWLDEDYDFYFIKAMTGVDDREYFKSHFQQLLGKFYAPFEQYKDIYFLALEKGEKYQQENKLLLNQLKDYFFVERFKLEKDQQDVLVRIRTH